MAAPSFTDCAGKIWRPVCTVEAVIRFERATGIGLFQAIFETLEKATDETDAETVPGMDIMRMSKTIFGSFEPLMVFLFECVREDEATQKLSLEDFCRRVHKEQVLDAMMCALGTLMDFFPQVDPDKRAEEALGPFAPTHGKTSTESPESPESTQDPSP